MYQEDDQLINYLEKNSDAEPELLVELRRQTYLKVLNPRMLSGHLQGRMLSYISKLIKPRNILEIGTYTGYATICLSEGLVTDGKIHTIEINPELEDMAKVFFKKAGIEGKVNYYLGDAIKIIEELKEVFFDLVFLDADKIRYPDYLPMIINRLNPGGVLIADNVLWSGKVFQPENNKDDDTSSIVRFNEMVRTDDRLEKVMIPLRDGLFLIRKKQLSNG